MSELSCRDGVFLRDLLPALAARLGLADGRDRVGLPDGQRWVVVMVDGLGWDIVLPELADTPYLAEVIGDAQRIVAGLPSTTAASLTSLWTGLPPGEHGVIGFSFEVAGQATSAKYPDVVVPLFLRRPLPLPVSWASRLVDAGVALTWVIPPEHVRSGFTAMLAGRARLIGLEAAATANRVQAIVAASQALRPSLTYVYDGRLDHAGHAHGVRSPAWRTQLGLIDRFLADLRQALPDDVRLVVTGDHGMIDVGPADRLVIDQLPDLARDVRLVAGEARCRYLYADRPAGVVQRWADRLGDQAWVLTRAEAIDQGLFGPVVDPVYADRIGQVVVVARGPQAYLSRRFPAEFALTGFHGAASAAERFVPLVID